MHDGPPIGEPRSVRNLFEHDDTVVDLLDPYRDASRIPHRSPCWVMANMVSGIDGTAAVDGRVGALSAGADAELFLRMRGLADVVLVGAETVRRERYRQVHLSGDLRDERRLVGRAPNPPIAVVSRSLDLDWSSPLFVTDDTSATTLVITCRDAPLDKLPAGVDAIIAGTDRVDIGAAVQALADRGFTVVLCEGGPTRLGEIVTSDLLDERCRTLSPVMGGDDVPIARASELANLARFRLVYAAVDDGTLFLRYLAEAEP